MVLLIRAPSCPFVGNLVFEVLAAHLFPANPASGGGLRFPNQFNVGS